ncbi:MAG: hypothetical protein K2O18_14705 [Oscillospiraceae bacterium]|nr:hypothetical protein [Oscillospiraceae bacterium]
MRLFWQEMQKIWRPGILAALVVLGVLFYFLRPKFWIELIPKTQNFDNSLMLVERYGPVLTAEIRPELDAIYEEIKENFNLEVKKIPGAAEIGITDLESYWAVDRSGEIYEVNVELFAKLWRLSMPANDFRLITGKYDGRMDGTFGIRNSPHLASYAPQAQTRIIELEERELRTKAVSFMDHAVPWYTSDWGRYLVIWTVLSVTLLLSPTLVRDRIRRTIAMQWTSRRGRRAVRTQTAAALASALLLALINLIVYFAILAQQGSLPLWNCPIYCGDGGIPWFDWTYGQFILMLIGMNFAFALAAGGLAVFLSQFSTNYVPMLLKAIPVFLVVGLVIANWALSDPFLIQKSHYRGADNPKGIELVCVLLLLAVSLGSCVWMCSRQQQREAP